MTGGQDTTATPDGLNGELAARVKGERQRRGWSLTHAATQATMAGVSVSHTTWANYEAGKTGLTGLIRQAVAGAFGWPLDWPSLPPEISDVPPGLLDDVAEILTILRRIEENQGTMAEFAAALGRRLDEALSALPRRKNAGRHPRPLEPPTSE